jgi:hypothetical protein
MKAAIYARVSTANNGQDPRVQTRELGEFLRAPRLMQRYRQDRSAENGAVSGSIGARFSTKMQHYVTRSLLAAGINPRKISAEAY